MKEPVGCHTQMVAQGPWFFVSGNFRWVKSEYICCVRIDTVDYDSVGNQICIPIPQLQDVLSIPNIPSLLSCSVRTFTPVLPKWSHHHSRSVSTSFILIKVSQIPGWNLSQGQPNTPRFYIGESARAKNGPELLAACAESRSMGDLDLSNTKG